MRPMQLATIVATLLIAANVTAQHDNNTEMLNPNLASEKELSAFTELNVTAIRRIIDERPFSRTSELDAIVAAELSAEQKVQLYKKLFVPINLNDASRAEIMRIPGMSKRMAHEFEEYRPYTSLEQFRREIGKYVDADEVTRLERYVDIE